MSKITKKQKKEFIETYLKYLKKGIDSICALGVVSCSLFFACMAYYLNCLSTAIIALIIACLGIIIHSIYSYLGKKYMKKLRKTGLSFKVVPKKARLNKEFLTL